MKKIWIAIVLALVLTGCKAQQDIRLDTIVDIPLHPTQPVVETVPQEEETTIPATEVSTEPETVPTEEPTKDTGKTGSGGKTDSSGGKTEKPTEGKTEKPTAPPATQPPTEPPTQPPTEAPVDYDPGSTPPGALEYGIMAEINARRSGAGRNQLIVDPMLCALAARRAFELNTLWSHTRPDGTDFRTIFGQYGYVCAGAAENTYFGAYGAAAIVDKWMSDEAYSTNLLLEASAIGAGRYTDENGLNYVVVLIVW